MIAKEEAASKLVSMYAADQGDHEDANHSKQQAVTIAVAALAESLGRDSCAECHEERGQLGMILNELNAIRSALEAK